MRSRTVNSSDLLGSPCSTAISAPLGKIGGAGPHWMSSPGPAVASRESNGVVGSLLLLESREHAANETIARPTRGKVRARVRMAVSPSIVWTARAPLERGDRIRTAAERYIVESTGISTSRYGDLPA